ncbi:fumarate hydratase, partial [Klebsiella quasipneumoniae]|uniref:fumarate hydratase n=1 Tax=Klebsiella quasipneumoniae TaxID=1463165 RepID=UPI000F03FEE4
MSTKPFVYQDPFPLAHDDTEYYLLSKEHVSVAEFDGQEVLKVEPQALTLLAQQAFHDAAFMLRVSHQQQVASILLDPEASDNDKYVALQFLRNSEIAAKGVLPTCQDTGTAIIMGKKGQRVWTGGGDEAALAQGVYNTYTEDNLRYSQNAPLDMYKEVNTGTNLPAQIDLYSVDGDEYKFLCMAKGGGSANKTYLYQETKALITPAKLKNYLVEKMRTLGTAACPPYHIAFVIGGTSAEATLKTVKLASTRYYDGLPTEGNEHGQAFRDVQLEQELLQEAQNLGLGAQFGGKYFAHDIRVIRLPRHGASCPIGMGVSCSADRNNQPMSEILAQLSAHPVSTRLSLNGTIIVARDIAHAKLKELLDNGEELPQYVKDHPIYYAGPAKTPAGYASGSLGPTTAGRMDSYVDLLQSHGASMVMLAKGNRSQ